MPPTPVSTLPHSTFYQLDPILFDTSVDKLNQAGDGVAHQIDRCRRERGLPLEREIKAYNLVRLRIMGQSPRDKARSLSSRSEDKRHESSVLQYDRMQSSSFQPLPGYVRKTEQLGAP